MKMRFEILILITTLSLTIADVILPPEYVRSCVQYQPTDRQFFFTPNQYRTLNLLYGPPGYVPIWLNKPQVSNFQVINPEVNNPEVNNPQDKDPLLGSPQNPELVSQIGGVREQKLKIGGHKVVQPSYLINRQVIVPTIHRRFKKSVRDRSDSGETGKTDNIQPDTSLNDQVTLKDNENQKPSSLIIEGLKKQTTQIKNDPIISGTLFHLNPNNLNPEFTISSNILKIRNSTNLHKSKSEPSLSNIQKDNKETLKLENLTEKPILTNVPYPMPISIEPITKSKSMEPNIQELKMQQRSKDDEISDPITSSVQMKSSGPLVKPLVQQIYPTWSPIYNYNQNPLCNNLVNPLGIYTMYYTTDYCNKVLTSKPYISQPSSQLQQNYGTNQAANTIPSIANTYQLPNQNNYLSNNILEYPRSYPYTVSIYPNGYVPYVHNTQFK